MFETLEAWPRGFNVHFGHYPLVGQLRFFPKLGAPIRDMTVEHTFVGELGDLKAIVFAC
jgi:hypothetical protein